MFLYLGYEFGSGKSNSFQYLQESFSGNLKIGYIFFFFTIFTKFLIFWKGRDLILGFGYTLKF